VINHYWLTGLVGHFALTNLEASSSRDGLIKRASTITSTGDTTVNGDLGLSPGTAVTGTLKVTGAIHAGDSTAAQAQADLTTAYNDAAGRTVSTIAVAGNLGGQTLASGLISQPPHWRSRQGI
jgi:hypothetical protein